MMVIGISSGSFPEWSTAEVLKTAGKLKVNGISVESRLFENYGESETKRLGSQLEAGGFNPVVVKASGIPDSHGRIKELFALCEQLGAKVLTVAASPEAKVPELTEFFKGSVHSAEKKGIRLALDTSLPLGIDGLGEIVEKMDTEAFGFSFDTGNFLKLGEDPVIFASYLGKYVHVVSIKDIHQSACVPLGRGEVRIPELVQEMAIMGFDGMYCVEIDDLHSDYKNTESAVKKSVKYLNKLGRKQDYRT